MPLVSFSAKTHIGMRKNNEDCYACYPHIGLFLVADGMGGHAAGEVASALTAHSIQESITAKKTLKHAIEHAHQAVLDGVNKGIGGRGMGSTLVALHANHADYCIAWVGDSRAYLWRADTRTLTQLTKDHSYVQALFESGAITKDETYHHQDKNVITQCIGSENIPHLDIPVISGKWQPNDTIILCSDGLTDSLTNEQLGQTIANSRSLNEMTRSLIDQALSNGGDDNITVCAVSAPKFWHTWLYRYLGHRFTRQSMTTS